jgi:DNA-binding protein HU-beta
MTKAEFVDKLAEKGQTTKKHASDAIELVFQTIADALVAGQEISVPGFGKFSIVLRKARSGINPRTKEKIKIKAAKAPKFSPAKALKESIK